MESTEIVQVLVNITLYMKQGVHLPTSRTLYSEVISVQNSR
jgi:hypothetical protein